MCYAGIQIKLFRICNTVLYKFLTTLLALLVAAAVAIFAIHFEVIIREDNGFYANMNISYNK